MTYADSQYISIARKSEQLHHKHTLEQIHAKIEQLTKSLAWEIEQNRARLQELDHMEDMLVVNPNPMESRHTQPTLLANPSSNRKKGYNRKHIKQTCERPLAKIAG